MRGGKELLLQCADGILHLQPVVVTDNPFLFAASWPQMRQDEIIHILSLCDCSLGNTRTAVSTGYFYQYDGLNLSQCHQHLNSLISSDTSPVMLLPTSPRSCFSFFTLSFSVTK